MCFALTEPGASGSAAPTGAVVVTWGCTSSAATCCITRDAQAVLPHAASQEMQINNVD